MKYSTYLAAEKGHGNIDRARQILMDDFGLVKPIGTTEKLIKD